MMARRSAKEIGGSFKGTTFSRMGICSESGAITKGFTQLMRRHFEELLTGRDAFAQTNRAVLDVEISGFHFVTRAHLVKSEPPAIDA